VASGDGALLFGPIDREAGSPGERRGTHPKEAAMTVDQRADDDHVILVVHDLTYRLTEAVEKPARSRRSYRNASLT
jgi:hypothetical protein